MNGCAFSLSLVFRCAFSLSLFHSLSFARLIRSFCCHCRLPRPADPRPLIIAIRYNISLCTFCRYQRFCGVRTFTRSYIPSTLMVIYTAKKFFTIIGWYMYLYISYLIFFLHWFPNINIIIALFRKQPIDMMCKLGQPFSYFEVE